MSKEARVPTVWVHPKAYYTMSYWAKLAGDKSREMTCFARCILEDGDAVVTDVYMVKHQGNSGAVEADDEDVVRLMMELNAEGVPPDEAFRCWVHSHPGTGPTATYLSGTDEEMIERFMSGDFLVSIVWDSAGGSPFCRIDYKNPRVSVVADVELYLPYLTAEELKEAKEEYDDKASAMSPPATRFGSGKKVSNYSQPKKFGNTHGDSGAYAAYDYDEYEEWTDPRTGSYTSSRGWTTGAGTDNDVEGGGGKSPAATQGLLDTGLLDIDGLDDDELRSRVAETFELDDEEVQQQWLEWIKDDPVAFSDMLDLSRQEAVEGLEYEATDEGGNDIVMIDLVDDDEVKAADTAKSDAAPGKPSDDELGGLGDPDGTRAIEVDVGDDLEGDSQNAINMKAYLLVNTDIDAIAMRVADREITKEEGMTMLTSQHELSEEDANSALEWRVG